MKCPICHLPALIEAPHCTTIRRCNAGHRFHEAEAQPDHQEPTTPLQAGNRIVGFGKHNGKRISEIPLDYVQWMADARFIPALLRVAAGLYLGRIGELPILWITKDRNSRLQLWRQQPALKDGLWWGDLIPDNPICLARAAAIESHLADCECRPLILGSASNGQTDER